MPPLPAYDLAPILQITLAGAALAGLPLAWVWARHRRSQPGTRQRALLGLALFLTFDLVLFGAFTRLSDSGLGCPDWPGCYGSASPLGAQHHIDAAVAVHPDGVVTHGKAWVEMIHRYLATGVGALLTLLMVMAWRGRLRSSRHGPELSPAWTTLTFAWVCLQGAFGAWTVTMKLYPAIVVAHLLGGLVLLALLAIQVDRQQPRSFSIRPGLRAGALLVALLALVQICLGGWVSTNYAVLACPDFPTCQGRWWPPTDFDHGFAILRPLGEGRDGGVLPFEALTAIHLSHRLFAIPVLAAMAGLAWGLRQAGPQGRRFAIGLVVLAIWQAGSGISNVVLGWPLLAALGHTGGAAALTVLLARLIARTAKVSRQATVREAVADSTAAATSGTARWHHV